MENEIRDLLNQYYGHVQNVLDEKLANYGDAWANNVGDCPNWFYGICRHEFDGDKPCPSCIRFNKDVEEF